MKRLRLAIDKNALFRSSTSDMDVLILSNHLFNNWAKKQVNKKENKKANWSFIVF